MSKDQKVVAMLPVTDFAKDGYVMLLSRNGFIKRMTLEAFAKNRQGTNAMDLVSFLPATAGTSECLTFLGCL